MASFKRTNPADVANLFVRNILCDLSEAMGGCSEDEIKKTMKFFDYKCPYTGEKLRENFEQGKFVLDHLIPQNKDACGLHVYGNLIPTSSEINSKKSRENFEVFIKNQKTGTNEEKEARIRKIKEFQEKSGFNNKFLPIEEKIKGYCKKKYQSVLSLLKESKSEICKEVGVQEVTTRQGTSKKGAHQYLFNGDVYTTMSRLALAVVKKYAEDHPGIDYENLKKAFLLKLGFNKKYIVQRVKDLTPNEIKYKRALVDSSDLIVISDANDVCINSQWQHADMSSFIKLAKRCGYEITEA